jgi:hypothetical protein
MPFHILNLDGRKIYIYIMLYIYLLCSLKNHYLRLEQGKKEFTLLAKIAGTQLEPTSTAKVL